MTEQITIVACFRAKPGKQNELEKLLTELLEPTRQEDGCLNYDLHKSQDDPQQFMLHENWTCDATYQAHRKSAHLLNARDKLLSLLEGEQYDVSLWTQINN
jgi:quinol monooxygenase YgiN